MFTFRNKIGTVGGVISLGVAALGLLAVVSCSSSTVPPSSDSAVNVKSSNRVETRTGASTLEAQVASGINEFRRSKGKAPLARHPGLDRLARQHAQEMQQRGKMDHRGYDQRAFVAQKEYGLGNLTENVIWGRGLREAGLGERIVNGWVGSKGHRMNLLYDNNYTGIGVVRGADGSFYAAQISARPHERKPLKTGWGPRTW